MPDIRPRNPARRFFPPTLAHRRREVPPLVGVLLGVCLAGLLWHIAFYDFLCDDAFISFRYARNFAMGHGLVFNPGFERVEGYTNFLWVVLLSAGSWLGIAPQTLANPLSILASLGLALWLLWFCNRNRAVEASPGWLLVPAAFLAANRSYAVWSTSGLETRLFELLIVGGVLRTLDEMKTAREGGNAFPFSAVLLGFGTLTRPDGLLVSACVISTRIIVQLVERTLRPRPILIAAAVFGGLVGGHYLFRYAYYGDWLPNTFYAKVSGPLWWDMGAKYLAGFALEYGLALWVPVLVAAGVGLSRAARSDVLQVFLAAIVPHAIFVAAIGGDHFEYRPCDIYIPLLLVLLFFGACTIGVNRAASIGAVAYLAIGLASGLLVPALSRWDAPSDYRPGFPGVTGRDDGRKELIDSVKHPLLFNTPGLGSYLRLYNDLASDMSQHFVGLRQEEHKQFLSTALRQGRWLAELVDSGWLPEDLYIAISCVGAIPYESGLRTLDRLGLTDREIARGPTLRGKRSAMAHDKVADPAYVIGRGVDLSSADNVHLVLPLGHPLLFHYAHLSSIGRPAPILADVGHQRYLLAWPIQGLDALRIRCPRLRFLQASEYLAIEEAANGSLFKPTPPEEQLGMPYDVNYERLAAVLIARFDDTSGAEVYLQRALATNPRNLQARQALGAITAGGK